MKAYLERQGAWVLENSLKVGDTVRVTREMTEAEKKDFGAYASGMSKCVSWSFKVNTPPSVTWGICTEDSFVFPYFVLEKVNVKSSLEPVIKKDSKPKYKFLIKALVSLVFFSVILSRNIGIETNINFFEILAIEAYFYIEFLINIFKFTRKRNHEYK